jgi:metal-responsive CopG/Arc/MetJ family transcriptional regulator
MKENRSPESSLKAQRKAAVRASITFPPDLYENLENIAQQKKVSLAWVVREAAEKYVEGQGSEGKKASLRGCAK